MKPEGSLDRNHQNNDDNYREVVMKPEGSLDRNHQNNDEIGRASCRERV